MAAATPSSGEAPLTVDFSSTGSNDPDGDIETYEWAFPDGSTITGASAEYEFTEAGGHIVHLTVTDDGGALAQKEVLVTVTENLTSPRASFNLHPSNRKPLP